MSLIKVGIIGASGMIGSYLSEHFTDVNLSLYSSQESRSDCRFFLQHLDPKLDQLSSFLKSSSDVIIHLAHDTNPIESSQNFSQNFGKNITFTHRLISELGRQQNSTCPLLIYLSSGGAVYGNVNPILGGISETHSTFPISPYGVEKLTCEHLLHLGALKGYYKLIVLRVSNVFGLSLEINRKQGVIGVWLSRIKAGLPLTITMDLKTTRDYLHIHDLTIAIKKVIDAHLPNDFYCLNLGTGHGHSITEIIKLLEKTTQQDIKIEEHLDTNVNYAPTWNVLNFDKMSELTGWKPIISLESGIISLWSTLQKLPNK
jgi:UDP-glucose 4-epimerase